MIAISEYFMPIIKAAAKKLEKFTLLKLHH